MTKSKKYLSGWQSLADRYGTTPRSCQRMVKDGRLPPPGYMGGSRSPLWDLEILDEHDRKAITKRAGRAKQHADMPSQ